MGAEAGRGVGGVREGRKALRLLNTFITKKSARNSCGLEVFVVGHLWWAVRLRLAAAEGGGGPKVLCVCAESQFAPRNLHTRILAVPEPKAIFLLCF